MVGILKTIIRNLKKKYYSSSYERKIKYLRDLGAIVGDKTRIAADLSFIGSEPYLVEIGCDCFITYGCRFITHDGGVKVLNSANYFNGKRMDKMGRIKIGNNVYMGNYATIMPNVTIGDNVIIGLNSIVTKDIPSNVVVAGAPAKVICTLQEYFEKNSQKNVFFETAQMSYSQKKKFLLEKLPRVSE